MSYLLPPGETHLSGACAAAGRLCVWTGRTAHRWTPDTGWSAVGPAPTSIDSGFEVQSGILAGADRHVGFLPADGTDWAWWTDLSAYSNAHPMYGDLLLCTDEEANTSYHLFSISEDGLEATSEFGADELATPVAGWSSPPDPERLLLLGDGGLWALDPPYTADALQHLVSFNDVELPLLEEIPGPFQPGVATVVIPRRTRTALRLDLSDGTGRATGLKYLPGDAALWTAYLRDDRSTAARVLATLTHLPAPPDDALHLHDVLLEGNAVRAVATSAGLHVPTSSDTSSSTDGPTIVEALPDAPLDASALATWALWLDGEDALEAACHQFCTAPDPALTESLRVFAGADACAALLDLLQSADPPLGPSDDAPYPHAALRALVAPFGTDVAGRVASALSASAAPARAAASAMAGALPHDEDPSSEAAPDTTPSPALWGKAHALPEEALRTNAHHDHPAVRAAARDTCDRLGITVDAAASEPSSDNAAGHPSSDYSQRSVQSSQPESPK